MESHVRFYKAKAKIQGHSGHLTKASICNPSPMSSQVVKWSYNVLTLPLSLLKTCPKAPTNTTSSRWIVKCWCHFSWLRDWPNWKHREWRNDRYTFRRTTHCDRNTTSSNQETRALESSAWPCSYQQHIHSRLHPFPYIPSQSFEVQWHWQLGKIHHSLLYPYAMPENHSNNIFRFFCSYFKCWKLQN